MLPSSLTTPELERAVQDRSNSKVDSASVDALLTHLSALNLGGITEVSDNDLEALHGLFGSVLPRALSIIEESGVSFYFQKESQHIGLYKVDSKEDTLYLYPTLHFCPCVEFKDHGSTSNSKCVHILAVKLSEALKATTRKPTDIKELEELYLKLVVQ